MNLPLEVVEQKKVWNSLDELSREPCDKTAIRNLGAALETAGRRRDAARALIAFSRDCGGDAGSLRTAVNILYRLSDHAGAADAATELIKLSPYDDNGYYLRGLARFGAKDYERAIDDMATAVALFGDKTRISSSAYVTMSKSYEELGRPCDAMTPIATWVAIDPVRNDNSQTQAILAGLRAKGGCPATTGREETIPIARLGETVTIPVTVNGAKGLFILDTGATFVSLTRDFAARAGIQTDGASLVQIRTANGVASARTGKAQTVQFRSIKAEGVAVVVQETAVGFGNKVDGLLGMSFLSRFDLQIDNKNIRLRSRS
ncbi:aspartyl protease family protein [Alsobacter sp. SYSU M60028]|uniref:Aspartyl protease family protein n=1 Tax=Alsobacter ponti TaxID=2962936 RepID=A0ABT1L8V2_9HYPH|nr:aspartyl protease family protein [Alsobacter ponti]MCP8937160.1 aspartyl protease family protein [Alsobacter ponti]